MIAVKMFVIVMQTYRASHRGYGAADGGEQSTLEQGMRPLRRGWRLVALAATEGEMNVDLKLLSEERSVSTSTNFQYPDSQKAIDIMASGKLDLEPLLTHKFSFSEARHAFDVATERHVHGSLKVVLVP